MKFWKVLGIAALSAALVPYKVKKDEATKSITLESLLLRVKAGRQEGADEGAAIDVELLPLINRSKSCVCQDAADPFAAEDDGPVISVETVAEKVEDTLEKAADAVEDTVEKAVDAVEDVAEQVKDAATDIPGAPA